MYDTFRSETSYNPLLLPSWPEYSPNNFLSSLPTGEEIKKITRQDMIFPTPLILRGSEVAVDGKW